LSGDESGEQVVQSRFKMRQAEDANKRRNQARSIFEQLRL